MNHHIRSARRGHYGVRLALVSVGVTGLGIAATAGTSAAHNPTVAPSCAGLGVDFTQYEGPASNNTVTVTIDGAATVIGFGDGLSRSFGWSDTADHVWSVAIDANRQTGDPTMYDWSTSGTQRACVAPTTQPATTTTPAPAAPTTDAPTTTAPTIAAPTTDAPAIAAPATDAATTTTAAATTVAVASEAPAAPAAKATAVSAAAGAARPTTLPQTGSNTGLQLALAMTVLLAGVAMITITRRRTTTTDHHS